MERNYAFLDTAKRGVFFDKKEYDHKPLPVFEEIRDSLPDPKVGAKPEWNECYWYTVKVCSAIHTNRRKEAVTSAILWTLHLMMIYFCGTLVL